MAVHTLHTLVWKQSAMRADPDSIQTWKVMMSSAQPTWDTVREAELQPSSQSLGSNRLVHRDTLVLTCVKV